MPRINLNQISSKEYKSKEKFKHKKKVMNSKQESELKRNLKQLDWD